MATVPRIDPDRLIEFATAVYAAQGMPGIDARLVADTLVHADLWGISRMACCVSAGTWTVCATAS